MYPFYNTNTQGLSLLPMVPFFPGRRTQVPTLDNRGIYEVCSTGLVETTGATADYGINPCIWKKLPNQCIILWKVKHPTTAAGQGLPVTVVIPTSNSSTVNSDNANSGSNKVPVVDNKNTQVTGTDVNNVGVNTEHIVYIDKCAGIFKLLGVTAAAAAPAS